MINEITVNTILKPPDRPEEKALVCRSLSGDQKAQYIIYKKYVGAMFHTIVRMVGSREDTEDLTQEVFVKVFQKMSSFRGDSTLGAWIKKIAVNAALSFIRQKKQIFFKEINEQIVISDKNDIDENEWADNIAQIHEAIKKLPDGCRLVFNLYLLEGYQHKEVAKLLDITESTSKTQYRRAKYLLKEQLINKK